MKNGAKVQITIDSTLEQPRVGNPDARESGKGLEGTVIGKAIGEDHIWFVLHPGHMYAGTYYESELTTLAE